MKARPDLQELASAVVSAAVAWQIHTTKPTEPADHSLASEQLRVRWARESEETLRTAVQLYRDALTTWAAEQESSSQTGESGPSDQ